LEGGWVDHQAMLRLVASASSRRNELSCRIRYICSAPGFATTRRRITLVR
jgi:hypothetical protein